jgi:hypothetical protein
VVYALFSAVREGRTQIVTGLKIRDDGDPGQQRAFTIEARGSVRILPHKTPGWVSV